MDKNSKILLRNLLKEYEKDNNTLNLKGGILFDKKRKITVSKTYEFSLVSVIAGADHGEYSALVSLTIPQNIDNDYPKFKTNLMKYISTKYGSKTDIDDVILLHRYKGNTITFVIKDNNYKKIFDFLNQFFANLHKFL